MRLLHSSVRRPAESTNAAFAVVVVFFGVAFIDSIVAHAWGAASVFALLAAIALYADRRRTPPDE